MSSLIFLPPFGAFVLNGGHLTLEFGAFVHLSYHDFGLDFHLFLNAFPLNSDVNPYAPHPNDLPEPIPVVVVSEDFVAVLAQNGNPTDQISDQLDLPAISVPDLPVADSFAIKEKSQQDFLSIRR